MTEYESGQRVEWTYGNGIINSGRSTGEVLEAGIEKYGRDDVMKVRSDQTQQTALITAKDVVRVID